MIEHCKSFECPATITVCSHSFDIAQAPPWDDNPNVVYLFVVFPCKVSKQSSIDHPHIPTSITMPSHAKKLYLSYIILELVDIPFPIECSTSNMIEQIKREDYNKLQVKTSRSTHRPRSMSSFYKHSIIMSPKVAPSLTITMKSRQKNDQGEKGRKQEFPKFPSRISIIGGSH